MIHSHVVHLIAACHRSLRGEHPACFFAFLRYHVAQLVGGGPERDQRFSGLGAVQGPRAGDSAHVHGALLGPVCEVVDRYALWPWRGGVPQQLRGAVRTSMQLTSQLFGHIAADCTWRRYSHGR